jgi:RNA polymerase sigma factor for flagellar operon FliA
VRGAVLDQLRALDDVPRKARCALRALERVRRVVEQREGRNALAEEIAAQLGWSRERFEALRARLARLELRAPLASAAYAEPPVPWTVGSEVSDANPLRALDAQRERAAVQRALAALPEAEREIVRLTYWEELPLDAVAQRLRLDICRVRNLHARGLLRLRGRLRDRFE